MPVGNLRISAPANSSAVMDLHVEWSETSTDIASNTSTVSVTGYIYNPLGSTLFDTYGNGNGVIRLYWNDPIGGTRYLNSDVVVTSLSGYQTIYASGSITVAHRSDGSQVGYAGIEWAKNSGLGWMPNTAAVSTGGYSSLTTIPRASTVSEYSIYPNENKYSMKYVRLSGSFREKLRISIPQVKAIKTVQGYESGTVVSLTDEEMDQIYEHTKNLDKGRCKIGVVLETWNSNFTTKIGESEEYIRDFTCTEPPTIGEVVITEEGIVKELLTESGSAKDYVASLSSKRIKTSAVGLKKATIKSIVVSVGRVSQSSNTNEFNLVFSDVPNPNNTIEYKVVVTDSRNNTSTWTTSATYHQYTKPSFSSINITRNGAESSSGVLTATGEFWKGTISNLTNELMILITNNTTGTSSGPLEVSTVGNKWTFSYNLTDVDPNKSYSFTVAIADALGSSLGREVVLSVESPLMQLGKTQVNLNNTLYFSNKFSAIAYNDGSYTKHGVVDHASPDINNWTKISEIKLTPGSFWNIKYEIAMCTEYTEAVLVFSVLGNKSVRVNPTSSYYDGDNRNNLKVVIYNDKVEVWIFYSKVNRNSISVNATVKGFGNNINQYTDHRIAGEFTDTYHGNLVGMGSTNMIALNSVSLKLLPVGTVISNAVASFDPTVTYGGIWIKITDRILMGAGNIVKLSQTAGNQTHTHGELNSRNGTLSAAIGATTNNPLSIGYIAANDQNVGANGFPTYTVFTGEYDSNHRYFNHYTRVFGETAPGSSLPPVLGVNIWRRVS